MYLLNDDNSEEITHDRAMLRLYDKRQYLLAQLLRVVKEPYMDSFIGMFLFSYENDEPNAMKLAESFDLNKKDLIILKEDVDEFMEIENEEDFLDNFLGFNGDE